MSPDTPQRRKTDRGPGWLRWVRHTYSQYGAELQLAVGILLMIVATVVVFVAFQVRGQGNDIQDQRTEVIITACREQNARNRNTIRELRALPIMPRDGRTDEQRQASIAATIRLINALAPVKDCEARARRFVQK
jgi:hypothetical protein